MVFCLLPANRGDVSFMSLKTPLLRFLWPNCDAFLSFFALITCFHLFAAELVRCKPYLPEDVFAKLLNFLLITPKIGRVFWLNYAVFRFITIKRSFTCLSLNLVALALSHRKKSFWRIKLNLVLFHLERRLSDFLRPITLFYRVYNAFSLLSSGIVLVLA